MDPKITQALESAFVHYRKGNLPLAELICRYFLSHHPHLAQAHNILGMISNSLEMYDIAADFFHKALSLNPQLSLAKVNLQITEDRRRSSVNPPSQVGTTRFLLIKSWGHGMWSDIDHVLGQLLLAEMTGRIPVVHWGDNSLFGDGGGANAFELYFEPLSDYSIDDLINPDYGYFPPKWNHKNLLENNLNLWTGPYSRMAALYFLNRPETVAVSDFFTPLKDVLPWVQPGHPLFGKDPEFIYRHLMAKYIRPRIDILREIDEYWDKNLRNQPVLAVHIRGSDKLGESPELMAINQSYRNEINTHLSAHPDANIFLLTDTRHILAEYQDRFRGRLIHTHCVRTDGDKGVHYLHHEDKRRVGVEVIIDTYLAARCEYFIGNGHSNVSTTILHLKEWLPGKHKLVTENRLYVEYWFMHNW